MLVLGFAELLGGGLLLTSAITGHSIRDVLSGRASPLKPLTSGQAPRASSSPAPDFDFDGGGGLPGLLSPGTIDMTRKPRGVVLSPSADRSGMPTKAVVKAYASAMSALIGKPVTIGTGSNHSQMTASGNVSDHWGGMAMDIPTGLSGQLNGDVVATAALTLAGVPNAAKVARGGGIHNINVTRGPFKGYRLQIIWRAEGHYDHVHVGFRKL